MVLQQLKPGQSTDAVMKKRMIESESPIRLEPLSSRRTFTTPHGEAANVLR